MVSTDVITELLLGPHVGSQEAVRLLHGVEHSADRVHEGSGVAELPAENVFNPGEGDEFLDLGGRDNTSTAGSGDEAEYNATALSADLGGNGVGFTELAAPISTAHGDEVHLGNGNCLLYGNGDLLRNA